MFVCLFVYFHQLSVTMNNNKVEGSNRDKTMKRQKLKEKFTPFDDDSAGKKSVGFVASIWLTTNHGKNSIGRFRNRPSVRVALQ